jgi:hypothetical protein
MKWKQKLAECGLNEQNISHGLKKKIGNYYVLQEGYDELNNIINDPNSNENEIDEAREDLQDVSDSLERADLELVKSIELYNKNKDLYAELGKNLKKGRPRKNPIEPQAQNQTPTPTPQPNPTPLEQPNNNQVDSQEPKKKSSFGWIAFGLLAGVVTLGAVNLLKDRD